MSRRNARLASRVDKYNIDSDVENEEEMDIELGQESANRKSVDNDEGAQEGEENEEQSDRDERVSVSTNNRGYTMPPEARENMRRSREMVDSGLNQ